MSKQIPQPPKSLFLGNVAEIDPERSLDSFVHLADKYGPVYRLDVLGKSIVVLSSQELVDEACDSKHFEKFVGASQIHLRPLTGDGLFTADNDAPNWKEAHNLLAKAFGPVGIRSMFPAMSDIAEQLVLKWERFGKDNAIDVPHDFTKLTLDTIALCAFGYRFNSFYREDMHPFVEAMIRLLIQAGVRGKQLPVQTALKFRQARQFDEDVSFIHQLCDDIIQERLKSSDGSATSHQDLLDLMLHGTESQRGLPAENIRYQMVTFLIAGHETTSGLLSFAFYYLLRNPSALQKAQAEVDAVTKGEAISFSHMKDLRYIDAILKETLRLQPPVGMFSVKPKAGPYTFKSGHAIAADESIGVLVAKLHRDPLVWGRDADVFDPDRMLNGGFEGLPPNSWKPFGNGPRACIGRSFAWQEATLLIARLLQKFHFEMDDPGYTLQIKHTLTIKPSGFFMRARLRTDEGTSFTERREPEAQRAERHHDAGSGSRKGSGKSMAILFASNSGSCESFAQQLAGHALARGTPANVQTMDSAVGSIPKTGPVVIICPSYEGEPADNGRQFVAWLSKQTGSPMAGVTYAVFGAGHEDWVETYQKIPKLIDARMAELGGSRVLPRGVGNAAGDFFGAFEEWEENFFAAMGMDVAKDASPPPGISVQESNVPIVEPVEGLQVDIIDERRATKLGHKNFTTGVVTENRQLTAEQMKCGSAPKRHMEIRLPEGMTYRAGDYLAIMPVNPLKDIRRVLRHFNIPVDSSVIVKSSTRTFLPTTPLTVHTLLGGYVELSQPASRKNVEALVGCAPPAARRELEKFTDPTTYDTDILARRVSVLDLLELYPAVDLPFAKFLNMLPPMRIRQYSISSSPLWDPSHVTLTFDVLAGPAFSGAGSKLGVASTYLAQAIPGDSISCGVKASSAPFHLPADPKTPIVMVAAGSGISPMRAFVQERASMLAAGQEVGKALFYYGCRDPDEDYIYKDELTQWEALGAVSLRPCFSRGGNPKYVHERMYLERVELRDLLRGSGQMYVCGSASKLAKSVAEVSLKIYMEWKGCSEEDAKVWFDSVKGSRYATDVFG